MTKSENKLVDRAAIEAGLYNKKMQKFEWKDNRIVAIVCPDGTRLEFDNLKVVLPK